MARRSSASELLLFLFLFSALCVCSSGTTPSKNKDEFSHFDHKGLLNRFNNKATKHDLVNPTTLVTNPVTTPALSPPNDPTSPPIISIPSTYPIIASPNPVPLPGTIPSANPVSMPNNNPFSPPLPVTNPVTTPSTYPGVQPVTNPAMNPIPTGGVPVTNPGTVPVVPPGIMNAPAIPGQSWCIAKSGAPESALQQALDYSCGIGGADCSTIQEGGSCYNPNSLENHASYAFNSYYQKNPVQTSCDFGGAAMLTNVNPSSGSCIYPASGSSLPAPVMENPTPTLPAPATESSTGAGIPGAGSPPFGSNISNPASGGTFSGFPDDPSSFNATSNSSPSERLVWCVILVTSIITGRRILDI